MAEPDYAGDYERSLILRAEQAEATTRRLEERCAAFEARIDAHNARYDCVEKHGRSNQPTIDLPDKHPLRIRAEQAERDRDAALANWQTAERLGAEWVDKYEQAELRATNLEMWCDQQRRRAEQAERSLAEEKYAHGHTLRQRDETNAQLQQAEATTRRLREALSRASNSLRMVGDDYPGSSCHDWCHRAADDADSALLGFVPPAPQDAAYGYLARLFTHGAPQCEPCPDLMGLCTQIDNLLAGCRMDKEQAETTTRRLREALEAAHKVVLVPLMTSEAKRLRDAVDAIINAALAGTPEGPS